jgi:hypothetical protein
MGRPPAAVRRDPHVVPRLGPLDVAFVRAVTTAAGAELLPSWQDPLTVALPATPPLAAQPAIQLRS